MRKAESGRKRGRDCGGDRESGKEREGAARLSHTVVMGERLAIDWKINEKLERDRISQS